MIKGLKNLGFQTIAEREGHLRFERQDSENNCTVIVPYIEGGGDMAIGTIQSVLRQAGISREQLDSVLGIS